MRWSDEHGQAAIEWTALLLLVLVVLAAAAAVAPVGGTTLPRRIACALLGSCRHERLAEAYGDDVATLVERHAPNIAYEPGTLTLPVDFRRCRAHACSDAPDRAGPASVSARGNEPATTFTHVVDERASGGPLAIQYWLYYPDSTYLGPAHALRRAPLIGGLARGVAGHHEDDWESYQVLVGADGHVRARASAHNGYRGRKSALPNPNELPDGLLGLASKIIRQPVRRSGAWTDATGWTRVSRGSHAGHVVDSARLERFTLRDDLRLVPGERLSERARANRFAISPPWRKTVWRDPSDTGTT
jgi:hypothetical protein